MNPDPEGPPAGLLIVTLLAARVPDLRDHLALYPDYPAVSQPRVQLTCGRVEGLWDQGWVWEGLWSDQG